MKRTFLFLVRWTTYPAILIFCVAFMWASLAGLMSPMLANGIVFTAAVMLLGLLEKLLPYKREWQMPHGRDARVDGTSFGVMLFAIAPLTQLLTPFLVSQIFLLLRVRDGATLIPRGLPFWAHVAIVFLVAELGHYAMHRYAHMNEPLMRIHAAHHSAPRLYWMNGFRVHPLNVLWVHYATLFPLFLLGCDPGAIVIYATVAGVSSALQHANVDLHFGVLNWIFSTPEVHRWHHSTRPEEGNRNYGAVLMIWDQVFGTYVNRRDAAPERVGLFEESTYPVDSYVRQVLVPFFWRRWVAPK